MTKAYPGEQLRPEEVLRLAEVYRHAAELLRAELRKKKAGGRGSSFSHAPWRLLAVHAIELYLNALLLKAGHAPEAVRGMQHQFESKSKVAAGSGIVLDSKTKSHLSRMQESREYLLTRYDPERGRKLSEINRLERTLSELAKNAGSKIGAGKTGLPPSKKLAV